MRSSSVERLLGSLTIQTASISLGSGRRAIRMNKRWQLRKRKRGRAG